MSDFRLRDQWRFSRLRGAYEGNAMLRPKFVNLILCFHREINEQLMPVRSLIETDTISSADYTLRCWCRECLHYNGWATWGFFPVVLLTNGANLVCPLGYVLLELARILVRECSKEWRAIFLKLKHKLRSRLSLIVTDNWYRHTG